MDHVAFLKKAPLDRIRTGQKRAECRLAKNRPLAWATQDGDGILLKESGGEITLYAMAKSVTRFEHLTPQYLRDLYALVQPLLGGDDEWYWLKKQNSRFAVIIELENIMPISFPSHLTPRNVQSAWVVDFRWGHRACPQ